MIEGIFDHSISELSPLVKPALIVEVVASILTLFTTTVLVNVEVYGNEEECEREDEE
jgi:hypothetical protein